MLLVYHIINLALKDAVVSSDLPSVKVHGFGGEFNISSVWKLLVAGCVCVTEIRTRVFNVFVSSTKEFISTSMKRERVQRQKC